MIEQYFSKIDFLVKKIIFRDRKKKVAKKIRRRKKNPPIFSFLRFLNFFRSRKILSFPKKKYFFETEEKKITMTCWGISESSDACAREFKVLGESYVAHFFYLASNSSEKVIACRHDFLLPLLGLLTPRSRTLAIGPADRVCLRPFGEVRLRRDKNKVSDKSKIIR